MKKITEQMPAEELFAVAGDFGRVSGKIRVVDNAVSAEGEVLRAESVFEEDRACGVTRRRGWVENRSPRAVTLTSLSSRYVLDAGEYEVYTQYTGWQHESLGAWQELVTTVSAEGGSVRSSVGAAPFAVVWNKQTNRGTAFHLLASGAWEIKVSRRYVSDVNTKVVVELGFLAGTLARVLAPGETAALPDIITYPVRNRLDMDAYRLHRYCNRHYPIPRMPVMYNTWMCYFDKITEKKLLTQIPLAQKIGAEYFMVDAGWFGVGDEWWGCVGDWEENLTGALRGSMASIAERVREAGMKFGFWLEVERANLHSKAVAAHPDYYFDGEGDCKLLDFANPEAREYITNVVKSLLRKYGAEALKLDFNTDGYFDRRGTAFAAYAEGYRTFIADLRREFPDLYLDGCASGGLRTNLASLSFFDGFWISDNHAPSVQVRILKDTLLRMPPKYLGRWVAMRSLSDVHPVYNGYESDKILASGDPAWGALVGLRREYLEALFMGGIIGFTADLSAFSERFFGEMREAVAAFKRERGYWQRAECRILTNTSAVSVLQYSDEALTDVRIAAISEHLRQHSVRVYPDLPWGSYRAGNAVYTAEELREEGVELALGTSYSAAFLRLVRE